MQGAKKNCAVLKKEEAQDRVGQSRTDVQCIWPYPSTIQSKIDWKSGRAGAASGSLEESRDMCNVLQCHVFCGFLGVTCREDQKAQEEQEELDEDAEAKKNQDGNRNFFHAI